MTGALARRFHLGILLVVLLAFGLRLYAIDRQDIWGDEAFSIWLSSQPLPEVVAGGSDTHPPLYPFLLFLWLRLAGSSPLGTRLLSAFIGTLTVPVVYVLGRRAFDETTGGPVLSKSVASVAWLAEGLALRFCSGLALRFYSGLALRFYSGLAALLAALSPVLIYYSQETRMYGLVTLLAAASVYWTMRVYQQPQSKGSWLAYFGATLAAAYTHYYAFFVILAENLVVVLSLLRRRRRSDLGRWLAMQGALALAYLPWIVVQSGFLSSKASARFDEWDLSTAARIAAETMTAFGAGLTIPPAAMGVISVLFVIAVVAGLVALPRRRQPEPWLIASYLLLPLFLAWAVNPIMPFFYARYLLLIAPAFYLLAAWGVQGLGRLWQPGRRSRSDAAPSAELNPLSIVGALLLVAGSCYGLRGYYIDDAYVKGRYGQMMAHVQANALPGDGLLLANQLQRPIYAYYQPQGLDAYFFPRHEYPLEDPRTAQDLAIIADRHPRLWLVRFGNPAEYDPDGYLSRWLATHGSKAYFDGWGDADLSLYLMTPAAEDGAIQHPLRADLGGAVRLLGYALSTEQVPAGDVLLLTLYWQAPAPVEERYTVFTHLLDQDQQIVAQMDSEPQGGGLPTDRWIPGQVIQDNYALTLAASAVPGPHLLEVGMYRLETLERLPVLDPETQELLSDRVLLGTVEVVAP
jgi:hypothetical protein